jgi:hypothetical protein
MGTGAPDIRPVRTAEELRAFVDLPFAVYRESDPWVPALKRDDMALLEEKAPEQFTILHHAAFCILEKKR